MSDAGGRPDLAALRRALAPTPEACAPTDLRSGALQAAVLVALLDGGVLLTRRADTLRRHAGQVAFPGGRIEATDTCPAAAALREAEEEIGLRPEAAEILGFLPGLLTGTGFHVTPVVTRVVGTPCLTPAPGEVASIFTLSYATLMDPAAPRRRCGVLAGQRRGYWEWPHDEYRIWGATGIILMTLARALTEGAVWTGSA